jgi:tetratricopeptide (TPR) repeat protein
MIKPLTACLLSVVLVTTHAAAQPADGDSDKAAVAKQHFDLGLRYFNTQDFAKALVEFRQAYQLDAKPKYLYSLGQAHRKTGDCKSAIDAFTAFLRTNPSEAHAEVARINVERCQNELAEAEAAHKARLAAALAAKPRIERIELVREPWYTDRPGMALSIAGVVGLGVGGGLFWLSGARLDDAREARSLTATGEASDAAQRYRTSSVVTLVVSGALLAGGLIRLALRPARERRTDVSLAPNAGGAALVIGGSF